MDSVPICLATLKAVLLWCLLMYHINHCHVLSNSWHMLIFTIFTTDFPFHLLSPYSHWHNNSAPSEISDAVNTLRINCFKNISSLGMLGEVDLAAQHVLLELGTITYMVRMCCRLLLWYSLTEVCWQQRCVDLLAISQIMIWTEVNREIERLKERRGCQNIQLDRSLLWRHYLYSLSVKFQVNLSCLVCW